MCVTWHSKKTFARTSISQNAAGDIAMTNLRPAALIIAEHRLQERGVHSHLIDFDIEL
jgi:hypothetical protein